MYIKKEKYITHTFVTVVKFKKNYIHEKKMYFKKEKCIYRYFIEIFPPFFHYDYWIIHKYLIFWYFCHATRINNTSIWIFMIYRYAFWKKKKRCKQMLQKILWIMKFVFSFLISLFFFTLRRIQIQWGTRCDGRQANHQQGTGDDFRIRSENRRNSARQRKGSFSCATHVVETVILWRYWI